MTGAVEVVSLNMVTKNPRVSPRSAKPSAMAVSPRPARRQMGTRTANLKNLKVSSTGPYTSQG